MLSKLTQRAIVLAGTAAIIALVAPALAQTDSSPLSLTVQTDHPGAQINRDIFGQFAEHLGQGIYGGVWVGKNSKIPNVRGIRSDVVGALKAIKVPVVRWPGGCFADNYNWRNGIGPAGKRPVTSNAVWGILEPNTFGTDEYLDFIRQIGSEAYVSVNVGSSTPENAANWLEYMTTDKPTTLGKLRAANGDPQPSRIKYIGMGNEMWGCGGAMRADFYLDHLRQFVMHVNSSHPDQVPVGLFGPAKFPAMRIAVGDGGNGYGYTETIMKSWAERDPFSWNIDGISMHHYTWGEAMLNAKATGFGEKEYAGLLNETLSMEKLISERSATMDKYDPKKKVALVVDEWGVWLKGMPGLPMMYLKQQNSLRDAIAASMNLNIFARHADRVRMTNIAQMVNVLQSMILTDGPKMVLTPTYYIYKMYVPFQDAQLLPIDLKAGQYKFGAITLQQVDAIAAKGKDGKVWLELTNLDPNNAADVTTSATGLPSGSAVGEVLTADRVDSVNAFDAPAAVVPKAFTAKSVDGKLVLHLPPKSVTVVQLEP